MSHSHASASASRVLPTLFLACVVLLSFGLNLTHSYRIYAVSEELDVWSGGKWTKLPFYFGETEGRYFGNYFSPATFYPLRNQKVGLDRANNLFITEVNGVQGQRPFTTTQKWSTVNNTLVGNSFYIGRWAFDSGNNFYSVDRYNPAGPPRHPIVKMPSSSYNDDYNLTRFIGWASGTNDITSFRNGTAMVVVGDFTRIYNSGNVSETDGVDANHVALWDHKKGLWRSLGAGIPSVPVRVVSDKAGNQLVALTMTPPTLWRWNGTAGTWKWYNLTLSPQIGAPAAIWDIAFGTNKLFVIGSFFKLNGVGSRNVSAITFRASGALQITGIGLGLPGGDYRALWVRNDNQIFIGGATKGFKAVYEWRKGRTVPWDRIGALGPLTGAGLASPVTGIAVV